MIEEIYSELVDQAFECLFESIKALDNNFKNLSKEEIKNLLAKIEKDDIIQILEYYVKRHSDTRIREIDLEDVYDNAVDKLRYFLELY